MTTIQQLNHFAAEQMRGASYDEQAMKQLASVCGITPTEMHNVYFEAAKVMERGEWRAETFTELINKYKYKRL